MVCMVLPSLQDLLKHSPLKQTPRNRVFNFRTYLHWKLHHRNVSMSISFRKQTCLIHLRQATQSKSPSRWCVARQHHDALLCPACAAGCRMLCFGLYCVGLARLVPPGCDKAEARGGTWMFMAPEQMSGPPGITLGGQSLQENPYVCLETDVWSLGALICMLCHGYLPSCPGLPLRTSPQQVRLLAYLPVYVVFPNRKAAHCELKMFTRHGWYNR